MHGHGCEAHRPGGKGPEAQHRPRRRPAAEAGGEDHHRPGDVDEVLPEGPDAVGARAPPPPGLTILTLPGLCMGSASSAGVAAQIAASCGSVASAMAALRRASARDVASTASGGGSVCPGSDWPGLRGVLGVWLGVRLVPSHAAGRATTGLPVWRPRPAGTHPSRRDIF